VFEVAARKKWFFVNLKDVYYAPAINKKEPGYDAVYYFFCREPYKNSKGYPTAIIDLARDENIILQSFRLTTRRAVRKMVQDSALQVIIDEGPSAAQLDNFLKNYDDFTRQKGFSSAGRHRMTILRESNRLKLITASYSGEKLLQRLMVEDTDKVIPYYGYTTRLQEYDPAKLQLISRISKWVDYYSMLYWKNKEKKYYDLGGLFLDKGDKASQQVDHYKQGFRGELIEEYDFVYPLTWKGHLFCLARNFFERNFTRNRD